MPDYEESNLQPTMRIGQQMDGLKNHIMWIGRCFLLITLAADVMEKVSHRFMRSFIKVIDYF
jgi:hypothetical protein